MIQLVASNGFLTVNKAVAREVGLEAAALLGELASSQVYWEERGNLNEDGMFFETAETIEQNTTLTSYQQGKASKVLEAHGLIRTARKGVPAKKYFAVDADGLDAFFKNKFPSFLETRIQKNKKQDTKKLGSNNKRDNKKREVIKDKKDIVLNSVLSDPVKEKVIEFLEYRQEMGKPFKSERGVQTLINTVAKQEQVIGATAVINCIDTSMSNGWQGLFWDKGQQNSKRSTLDDIDRWAENMRRAENAEQNILG